MKITSVDAHVIHLPYVRPGKWASGSRAGSTRLFIVLHTDVGIVGYGETICLWDFVLPVVQNVVMPAVVGEDPHNVENIFRRVEGSGYYHHKRAMVAATAGVELAMWDAVGKAAGMPLHALWGGEFRSSIQTTGVLHADSPDGLSKSAKALADSGWETLKVKIGLDAPSDIATVEAARQAIGPEIQLRADVNGSWTRGTARRQLQRLAPFDLQFIEQPLVLDDLAGHAELRQLGLVPICLDESAFTAADVLSIITMGAADCLLLDAHEAGGWWQARKQAAIAEAAGLPVGLHSGGELGIATAANLHLAASTPNMALAIDTLYDRLTDDILVTRHQHQRGQMPVPHDPGLGVEVDWEKINRYTVTEIPRAYGDPGRPDWHTSKPSY